MGYALGGGGSSEGMREAKASSDELIMLVAGDRLAKAIAICVAMGVTAHEPRAWQQHELPSP